VISFWVKCYFIVQGKESRQLGTQMSVVFHSISAMHERHPQLHSWMKCTVHSSILGNTIIIITKQAIVIVLHARNENTFGRTDNEI